MITERKPQQLIDKGKYKGIEGSKTHQKLFKKKTGVPKPNPVADLNTQKT